MFDWWIRRKLESGNPEKRKKALEQLVKSGNYKPLMDVLKNPNLRDEAINEFAKMGQVAEDYLKAASCHEEGEVKAGAALALGRMTNSQAPDLLVDLLKDANAAVNDRVEAAHLLSETGDRRAIVALQVALEDQNPDLKVEAALSLGRMRESVAVEPLINLVANQQLNSKTRSEAARLLAEIGDQRSVETLKSLLGENDQLKSAAIRALGTMGIIEPLIQSLSQQSIDAVEALGESKAPLAVQPLMEALNRGDQKWHECVVRALGQIEAPQGLEAIYKSLALHKGTEWKLIVAKALGADDRAVEVIKELMENEERLAYGIDRRWAAASKERLLPFVQALRQTGNPLAQEHIGNLISKERKALDELMQANDFMHHYESLALLKAAATALGEIGNSYDFASLNLVSHQLDSYRQSILRSKKDLAWDYAERFRETGEFVERAIRRLQSREASKVAAQKEPEPTPESEVQISDTPSRLSMVVFRDGGDQPSRPEEYYEAIVSTKFGATSPIIVNWRILGLRERHSVADCAVLYKKMVVEGKLEYFGFQVDEWEGKGPDGREVVALFYSMEQPKQRSTDSKTTSDEAAVSGIQVKIESLRAVCVGFVNLQPREEEAFQLGLDLMERWNPKLYESFKINQPKANMRVFAASSLDRLASIIGELGNADYSDCLAVLQTGSFDTYQRSTDSRVRSEVILATFWKTGDERKTVIAPGMELSLLPAEAVEVCTSTKPSITSKDLWEQVLETSGEISEIKVDSTRREAAIRWWNECVKAMPSLDFEGLKYPPIEAEGRTWSMLGRIIYYLFNPADSTICQPCKESHLCWEGAVKCNPTDPYWKQYLIVTADVEDVRDAVNSTDPVLRTAAALRMAEHEKDASFLIELLKTGDHQMQEAAASALGRVADPSAVSALEAALHTGHYNTTQAALEALTSIGDPAVFALLRYLQEENVFRRKDAAIALGKVGNPQALGPLQEALQVQMPQEVEQAFRNAIEEIRRKGSR